MASYVVLEFQDDDEARYYAKDMSGEKLFSVTGLYQKPTRFCECTIARKPPFGWTRGPKYHWWICSACGKPSEQWSDALPEALGKNLLDG